MNVSKAIVLLGLTNQNQCDDKSIQIAWKRKLLSTHPDKSNAPAATALTQEINAAKDYLLNQAKHVIRAHFDSLAAKEKQGAAAEQEIRAARERARQAAAEHEIRAARERARQAAAEQEIRAARERARQAEAAEQEIRAARERARQAAELHNLFNTVHAQHSGSILPPELQESINHCIQDNLNYEQSRRTQQLRCRRTTAATANV
jgi:curved DNA-binding protein CbpA